MIADSTVTAPGTTVLPVPSTPTPAHARALVASVSARRAARSGVMWGIIFGVGVASSAISYVRVYKTQASRDALAATYGSSKAMAALFGPAPRLQTVAGFTAFKISMTLMVLGALWGLLTSTRLLRGEEDAGRWDLFLAGRTTRRGATVQAIAGLGAGAATLWVVTAVLAAATGRSSTVQIGVGASLYFALALVATPVMFLAVGSVTSQLVATRRQAVSVGAVLLGVAYGLRLIADAGVGLHAVIWASPLGWVEELRPLTTPAPLALLPIVGSTAVLTALAVHLAGRRDVGAGLLADRTHATAHVGLLVGPTGLAIRLRRATVIGWWAAIALAALLYGLIAKSAGATISGSVHQVFSKLGATGTGTDAVLGVCFLILAILIGFMAAGQVTATRAEESGGTLDQLLVHPVSRWWWLGGRSLVTVAVLAASGVLAGACAWVGVATQHAGVGVAVLLGAGVNLVPPAVVILGAGVLAFGVRPRATSWVVYGVLGWSLLLVIVGSIGAVNHWVLDTSVFHQMASAPAVSPHWQANAIMTASGIAAAVLGGWAFRRRDLQGD